MHTSRKKHSSSFKAQVAIEAIKEQENLSELSKRFWNTSANDFKQEERVSLSQS